MRHTVILTATLLGLVSCETTSAPTSPLPPSDRLELAATSLWMPLDETFPNECPPSEDVAFSGKAHFLIRESEDQRRLFINWAGVKGVGLVSGDGYVIQDNFKDEIVLSEDTEEIREHFRMLRQGSADNLLAVVHLIIDLTTGDVEVLEFSVECRG